jgi:hypothetical protein
MKIRTYLFVIFGFMFQSLFGAPSFALNYNWPNDSLVIARHLSKQNVINPERALVHLSLTCHLQHKNGNMIYIFEARELVKGGESPRGINQLLVLDSKLQILDKVELLTAHILYCEKDNIILDSDIEIERTSLRKSGNVLKVNKKGIVSDLQEAKLNSFKGIQYN